MYNIESRRLQILFVLLLPQNIYPATPKTTIKNCHGPPQKIKKNGGPSSDHPFFIDYHNWDQCHPSIVYGNISAFDGAV